MREYININLKVIKKHLKKRTKKLSESNRSSVLDEFREWSQEDKIDENIVWTLPDLTQNERFKNFCRSIKKEIR